MKKAILLLTCIALCSASMVSAQNIIDRQYLTSYTTLAAINSNVVDDAYPAIAANTTHFKDKNHFGLVTLGIDEQEFNLCYPNYVKIIVSGTVTGQKYTLPSYTLSNISQAFTLEAEYDPASGLVFSDKSFIKILDACSLKVTVSSISLSTFGSTPVTVTNPSLSLQDDMYIETMLVRERYYKPHPVTYGGTMFTSITADNTKNTITLAWTQQAYGSLVYYPDEYEIEWGYAHNYANLNDPSSTFSPSFTFKNNASRVRVKETPNFELKNVYDRGYLIFRIRGIWKDHGSFEEDIVGQWNTGTVGDVIPASYSSFLNTANGANSYVAVTPVAKIESKNWISSVSFAENGLHKPVVQYADGSGRVRQTVTSVTPETAKPSIGRVSIVTETFYDHRGRAAIQTLPVPVLNDHNGIPKNALQYFNKFNLKHGTSDKYAKEHFDMDNVDTNGDCIPDLPGFSDNTGAGQYYSSSNTIGGFHDALPNALTYPFTHTVYERDNTGRIRSQSGVGITHKTGSGHETVYQYNVPNQTELDRLFGTDVGYASHYKKNVVKDANGQYSVSYLNMGGKVIATSLAGQGPDALQPLKHDENGDPMYVTDAETITADLLNIDPNHPYGANNIENTAGDGRYVSHTFSVLENQDYLFDYGAIGKDFYDQCAPTLCADCVYDLKIRLTDRCGNNVLPVELTGVGLDYIKRTIGGTTLDIQCNEDSVLHIPSGEFTITLPEGVYTITKELSVNMAAAEYYAQQFIANNTCLPTLEDYLVVADDCYPDCELYPEECEADGAEYTRNFCNAAYEVMLTDMRPGGQYGHVHIDVEGEISEEDDIQNLTSVYLTANLLPKRDFSCGEVNTCTPPNPANFTEAHWRNPKIKNALGIWEDKYLDEDGNEARVQVSLDVNDMWAPKILPGIVPSTDPISGLRYVRPQDLKELEDFVAEFQYGFWEKSLVVYHPEYFFYEGCIKLQENTVTIGGVQMNTWEYEEFISSSAFPTFQATITNLSQLRTKDPLFQSGGVFFSTPFLGISGSPTYDYLLANKMTAYKINPETPFNTLSMLEMAYATAHCGGATPLYGGCMPSSVTTVGDDEVRDVLASLYISAKQELIYFYLYQYSLNRFSDVACIDGENVGISYLGIESAINPQNPCDLLKSIFYFEKDKRFINENQVSDAHGFGNPPDTEAMMEYANQAYFTQTGVCPAARDLELMLKLLANDHKLLAQTNLNITNASYLTPALTALISSAGDTPPIRYTSVYPGGDDKKLNISFEGISCPITLEFPSGSSYGFPNLLSIQSISNVQVVAGYYLFKLTVVCAAGSTQESIVISGSTCLPISGCESGFKAVCKVKPIANSLRTLLNAIAADGSLFCTGSCTMPSSLIPYVDSHIRTHIGGLSGAANYSWTWNGGTAPGKWTLLNSGNGRGIEVKIISTSGPFTPSGSYTWATVQPAISTTPANSQSNLLLLKGYPTGSPTYPGQALPITLTIEINPIGYAELYATDCQKVTNESLTCNTQPHKNLRELEELLRQMIADGTIDLSATEFCPISVITSSIGTDEFEEPLFTELVSISAFMDNQSPDGVNSYYFSASFIYDGQPLDITGKWCKPMRNCESCNDDGTTPPCDSVAGGPWYIKLDMSSLQIGEISIEDACFAGHTFDAYPVNPAYFPGYDMSSVILSHTNIPGWTIQQFYQDWANSINALGVSGITATIRNGSLYISFPGDILYTDPISGSNWNLKCNCLTSSSFNPFLGDPNGRSIGTVNRACCLPEVYSAPDPGIQEEPVVITATEWPPQDDLVYGESCNPAISPFPEVPYVEGCTEQLQDMANLNAQNGLQAYIDSLKADYIARYLAKCMQVKETLTMQYRLSEYHFTLYYYDRAGNLVRTVPPHAVLPLTPVQYATVPAARSAVTNVRPEHNTYNYFDENWRLGTQYTYNSLNAVTQQQTPDAGKSQFWYDNLGRIALSQNPNQVPNRYSYTLYDNLGRTIEVGEVRSGTVISESIVKDPASLVSWHAAIPDVYHFQITRTYYDAVTPSVTPSGITQLNLRGRVSAVVLINQGATIPSIASSIHYNYDFHGNVKNILNVNNALASINQTQTTVAYTYDLVSGKVLAVAYNATKPDAFYHRYRYDNDNRLLEAQTSADELQWDMDARYNYYRHGPLARTEYGNKVQGMDYAYTLQGWIKGINSDNLSTTRDIGRDGYVTSGNSHAWFNADAFSFSLSYHDDDYTPIVVIPGIRPFASHPAESELFNGNIRSVSTTLKEPGTNTILPLAQTFRYDQLNRIRSSQAYSGLNIITNIWSGPALAGYGTSYTYDPAGNIKTLNRKGNDPAALEMDALEYTYIPLTNQLQHVSDDIAYSANYTADIDDQMDVLNYGYDLIGNLKSDMAEQIQDITWTIYGKVKSVTRTPGSAKPDLEFAYNPMGQRISKKMTPKDNSPVITTYYTHDAQGNVMAIYTHKQPQTETETYTVEEHLLYGSSRLGVRKSGIELLTYVPSTDPVKHPRGLKRYELSNHLGNVQAVVSDRRRRMCTDNTFQGYEADIRNTYDYYAFGMAMPGRNLTAESCTTDVISVSETLLWKDGSSTSGLTPIATSVSSVPVPFTTEYQYQVTRTTSTVTAWGVKTNTSQILSQEYTVSYRLDMNTCSGTIWAVAKNASGTIITQHASVTGTNSFTYTADQTGNGTIEFVAPYGGACSFFLDDILVTKQTETHELHCYGEECQPASVNTVHETFDSGTGGFGAVASASLANSSQRLAVGGAYTTLGSNTQGAARTFDALQDMDHTLTFTLENTCMPSGSFSSQPLTVNVKDQLGTIVATQTYTASGTFSISFTPASSATYSIEFLMTFSKKFTSCTFHIDDVDISYEDPCAEPPVGTPSASSYRFGFNGKPKDNEVYGDANAYDFGARLYDPRIGRWMAVDPQAGQQPAQSPYKAFLNNPLIYIDPSGETEIIVINVRNTETGKTTTYFKVTSDKYISYKVCVKFPIIGHGHKYDWYNYTTTVDVDMSPEGEFSNIRTSGPVTNGGAVRRTFGTDFHEWDNFEGDGGTQRGGWNLVSGEDAISPTKFKALSNEESINIDFVLAAFGSGNVLGKTPRHLPDLPGLPDIKKGVGLPEATGKIKDLADRIKDVAQKKPVPAEDSAIFVVDGKPVKAPAGSFSKDDTVDVSRMSGMHRREKK